MGKDMRLSREENKIEMEPWESPSSKGQAEKEKCYQRNKDGAVRNKKELGGKDIPKTKKEECFSEKPVNTFMSPVTRNASGCWLSSGMPFVTSGCLYLNVLRCEPNKYISLACLKTITRKGKQKPKESRKIICDNLPLPFGFKKSYFTHYDNSSGCACFGRWKTSAALFTERIQLATYKEPWISY